MSGKIIEVGQFCRMQDNSLNEHGIKKGNLVYVAGDAVVNVGEKDPYELRRIFLGARVKDKHVDVDSGAFTIDGLKLKAVGKGLQEKLEAIKMEDFGDKEEEQPAEEE